MGSGFTITPEMRRAFNRSYLIRFFSPYRLPILYFVLAGVELINFRWPVSAAWPHLLSLAVYIFLVVMVLRNYFNSDVILRLRSGDEKHDTRLPTYILQRAAAVVVVIPVAFGESVRHLSYFFGVGFAGDQGGYWSWLRFAYSWVLDNVAFNASQIFGWDISSIHAATIWARIYVLVMNVAIEVAAIAVIITFARFYIRGIILGSRQKIESRRVMLDKVLQEQHAAGDTAFWRRWRRRRIIIGTMQEIVEPNDSYTYYDFQTHRSSGWKFLVTRIQPLLLGAAFLAPTLIFVIGILDEGLTLEAARAVVTFGTPALLSLWLLVYSCRAIASPLLNVVRPPRTYLIATILTAIIGAGIAWFTIPQFIHILMG